MPAARHRSLSAFIAFAVCLLIGVAVPKATFALGEDSAQNAKLATPVEQTETLPALMLKDALVLEDREGYNSEYIFGMTKAILNSTLHPAAKPLTCDLGNHWGLC